MPARSTLATLLDRDHEAAPNVPHTSFNGTVGPRRSLAWSSVSLDQVKALKTQLGVTVNDVVLGLSSAAVRRYLDGRGELPEEKYQQRRQELKARLLRLVWQEETS